ncbi:MAG: hypothetical protein Q8P67_22310, partial [archaeon]|nr:hypothetical protein [archaeon]
DDDDDDDDDAPRIVVPKLQFIPSSVPSLRETSLVQFREALNYLKELTATPDDPTALPAKELSVRSFSDSVASLGLLERAYLDTFVAPMLSTLQLFLSAVPSLSSPAAPMRRALELFAGLLVRIQAMHVRLSSVFSSEQGAPSPSRSGKKGLFAGKLKSKNQPKQASSSLPTQRLGSHYLGIAVDASFLDLYIQYAQVVPEAASTLHVALSQLPAPKHKKKAQQILLQRSMTAVEVLQLLSRPLQHIKEYPDMFGHIIAAMPAVSPDLEPAKQFLDMVSLTISRTGNDAVPREEEVTAKDLGSHTHHQTAQIIRSFHKSSEVAAFLCDREFVREGRFVQDSSADDRADLIHLFAFRDLILAGTPSGNRLLLAAIFPIDRTIVWDIPDNRLTPYDNKFQLSTEDGKQKLSLVAVSQQEKKEWIIFIMNLILAFSRPLQSLIDDLKAPPPGQKVPKSFHEMIQERARTQNRANRPT